MLSRLRFAATADNGVPGERHPHCPNCTNGRRGPLARSRNEARRRKAGSREGAASRELGSAPMETGDQKNHRDVLAHGLYVDCEGTSTRPHDPRVRKQSRRSRGSPPIPPSTTFSEGSSLASQW